MLSVGLLVCVVVFMISSLSSSDHFPLDEREKRRDSKVSVFMFCILDRCQKLWMCLEWVCFCWISGPEHCADVLRTKGDWYFCSEISSHCEFPLSLLLVVLLNTCSRFIQVTSAFSLFNISPAKPYGIPFIYNTLHCKWDVWKYVYLLFCFDIIECFTNFFKGTWLV